MTDISIRGYRSESEASLLEVWNRALPFDPVDQATFHRKALLDPNFDPDWLLVAEVGGDIVGFCLCVIRRVPLERGDLEPGRGWITALGVDPAWRRQGVGARLLDRALTLFREAGRQEALVAPYTPNYFVPGVDEAYYADGLSFLQKRGFEVISRPVSMDANLVRLDLSWLPEREARLLKDGVVVRGLEPCQIPDLLGLLQTHMPADWVRHAREVLTDATKGQAAYDQFIVAVRAGEVVGCCQFEGEHFGPFGVRADSQGKGIGTVLLARCVETMRRKGLHNAWVLWTSDETAEHVYSRFGFRATRRFAVLRKRL
jgi:GNAT superfamily N-acetyltransferase